MSLWPQSYRKTWVRISNGQGTLAPCIKAGRWPHLLYTPGHTQRERKSIWTGFHLAHIHTSTCNSLEVLTMKSFHKSNNKPTASATSGSTKTNHIHSTSPALQFAIFHSLEEVVGSRQTGFLQLGQGEFQDVRAAADNSN